METKPQEFHRNADYFSKKRRGQVLIPSLCTNSKKPRYLRNPDRARKGVKNWHEGSNADIDRTSGRVSEGGAWKVSNKLAREFPALAEAEIAEKVVKAVWEAFDDGESYSGRINPYIP